MTTKAEISEWFDRGLVEKAKYMIVLVDTFDHDDYPAYYDSADGCLRKYHNPGSMQRVMEVYDLTMDKEEQLNAKLVMNLPKETQTALASLKPKPSPEKIELLLNVLTSLTGLSLDDMLNELEGTEDQKAQAQMENVIKMAEHMNGKSSAANEDRF